MTRSATAPGRRLLLAWAVASVLLCVGGYLAGTRTGTGGGRAEENAQTTLTAYVAAEERVAAPRAPVVPGYGVAARTIAVAPGSTVSTRAIVTGAPLPVGADVAPGSVVVEVSDRPVIALALDVPPHRDLMVGAEGPDVRRLQEALRSSGVLSGAANGRFGPQTATAVARLYITLGYAPRTVAVEDQSEAATEQPTVDTAAVPPVAAPEPQRYATMPMDEVVAIGRDGGRVQQVAALGTDLSASPDPVALVVATGAPTVEARVSTEAVELFAQGAIVEVEVVGGGSRVWQGTIASVSEFTAETDERHAFPGFDLVITVDVDAAAAVGTGTQVTIRSSGPAPEIRGIGVPLTAIRSDGAGEYVLVAAGADARDDDDDVVRVEVLAEDGGYAILSTGSVQVGALVRIGG